MTEKEISNATNIGYMGMLEQIQEECAELIKAVSKVKRTMGIGQPTPKTKKEALDDMFLEMADVELCIGYLKMLTNSSDRIEEIKEKQIDKVYNRYNK